MATIPTFEAARERFLPELERRMRAAVEGDGVLFEAARYHLDTGGKRLRALLPPWIACNLQVARGETPPADLGIALGVGLELVHNGTLVHDDVQDGDTHRRGVPTVWVRYGMPQAVNLGTSLLFIGVAQILSAPGGHELIADVNLAILDIVAGQALEFELQSDPTPTTAKWERMAGGKTGALFSACVLAGAHAAGLRGEVLRGAARWGAALGVFFQLQDDLLDLVGDKQRDVHATDIAEGKVSWPVAWLAERAAAGDEAAVRDLPRLMSILRTPRADTSVAMIDEALGLLTVSGAIRAGLERVAALAATLEADPLSQAMPGLVQQVLEPIRHAL